MELSEALSVLGLSPGELTEASVKRAYRAGLRTAHPDRAGGGGDALEELRKAHAAALAGLAPKDAATLDFEAMEKLPFPWDGHVTEGPFAGAAVSVVGATAVTYKVVFGPLPEGSDLERTGVKTGAARYVKKTLLAHGPPPVAAPEDDGGTSEYEVTHKSVFVRRSPAPDAPVVGTLSQGDVVDADGQRDGFVRIGDGQWVMLRHPQLGALLRRVAGPEPPELDPPARPGAAARGVEGTVEDVDSEEEEEDSDGEGGGGAGQERASTAERTLDGAARDDSHPLADCFLPGLLPNFFTNFHDTFFPACVDEVRAEATLMRITNRYKAHKDEEHEKKRSIEVSGKGDGLIGGEDDEEVAKWTGLDDFPWNEPKQWIFVRDWLDKDMPARYAEEPAMPWRFSDKVRAWERAGKLEDWLPDDDEALRRALEHAARVVPLMSRVCRVDAVGNLACPFAKVGAFGDFVFDAFAPRARLGAVADRPENCVVLNARFSLWKGYHMPQMLAPEQCLAGINGFRARKMLNLIRGGKPGLNLLELLLGFVPNGREDQPELRVRDDLRYPLMGFGSRAEVAAFLKELHGKCEPSNRMIVHCSPGMSKAREPTVAERMLHFWDDESPTGNYHRYQSCSLCFGEQKYYKLPLGQELDEAPGTDTAGLCSNCEVFRTPFDPELVKTHIVMRTGNVRDREKWQELAAEQRQREALEQHYVREFTKWMNPRLDEAKADAHELIANLRAVGRHGDAEELTRAIESDGESDDELMEVF